MLPRWPNPQYQTQADRIRQDTASKVELAATRQFVEVFAKNLVNREHTDADLKLHDAIDHLAHDLDASLRTKADWNRVRENFITQQKHLLIVSSTCLGKRPAVLVLGG